MACPHCGIELDFEVDECSGASRFVGGYELVRELSHGGAVTVYLARQASMNRMVALKVLAKSRSAADAAVRFTNEVRISGKLQHPHIATAFDAGETDDVHYMAMTYVDGEGVDRVLARRGCFDEKRALRVALQISSALEYAWEKYGMTHRDINPGNIMLDDEDHAMLLNMGLAGDGEVSGSGSVEDVLGSPYYMSPEQSRGEVIDWTGDLYSLGAVIYHLLTGAPPFDDQRVMKVVEMHAVAPLPDPGKLVPGVEVSSGTFAILKRMMGKTPAERFESWGDYRRELKRLLKSLDADKVSGYDITKTTRTKRMKRSPSAPPAARLAVKKSIKARPATGKRLSAMPFKRSNEAEKSKMIKVLSFISLSMLILVAVLTLLGNSRSAQAGRALRKAENILVNLKPGDYGQVEPLFAAAAGLSVGTDYEAKAAERHLRVKSVSDAYHVFDSACRAAGKAMPGERRAACCRRAFDAYDRLNGVLRSYGLPTDSSRRSNYEKLMDLWKKNDVYLNRKTRFAKE